MLVLKVINVDNNMKLGKSLGPDRLHMEAFYYGEKRLCTLPCILFNVCMKFGYVPS